MPGNSRVPITLGLADHAAVRALVDGRVVPEGIDLTCVTRFPDPWMIVLSDRIVRGELDGGECSASFFIQNKTADGPVVGIPVFLYRSFRHRSIYRWDGSGIQSPADLRGKRIGLHAYSATTMIWARGILRDEYGIEPREIQWYTMVDQGAQEARQTGVTIELLDPPTGGADYLDHLGRLIQDGQLDGGICPRDISRPGVSRLFPNHAEVEAAYYRRTGVFPIIHTVALNERILNEHPWVRASLMDAFRKSAALAPEYVATSMSEHWDEEM